MIKKKITSILAAIMISTAVLTTNVQIANAQELTKIENTVSNLEDGNYTIKNKTSYGSDSSHGEAMARQIVGEDTKIKVENGKINVTLTLNEKMYNMLENIEVSLAGQKIDAVENKGEKTLTFSVPSLASKIGVKVGVKGMNHTQAFTISNDTTTLKKLVVNNIATIKNDVVYGSSFGYQMVRGYLKEESNVVEKEGKNKVTLTLTSANLMKNYEVSVNGENTEIEKVVENDEAKLTFNMDNLSDEIKVKLKVSMGFMEKDIEFGVNLLQDSFKIVDSKTEEVPVKVTGGDNNTEESKPEESTPETGNPEESKPEENKPENTTPETSKPEESTKPGDVNTGNEAVGTKIYTIENDVIYDNPVGYQMARNYLEKISKVEVIDGKYFVTLTFTGTEYMSNHEVYVNGNKINATVTNTNGKAIVKFEVASLNEDIKVSTYVAPMSRNVEFGVALKNDTLKLVSGSTADDVTTNDTTSGTTNNNSNNAGTNTEANAAPVIVKGKLYSIKNKVTHENATGQAMARKYLNDTSYVEEVNGKYFVTLTFTGKEFMQKHVVYVNGKKANATITNSGDEVKVRFEVSKLSDSIKVSTYVVPMSRNVEFSVELLENTLTFIKEYDVENGTLPQTGSPINPETAAALGTILLGAGYVLIKRK